MSANFLPCLAASVLFAGTSAANDRLAEEAKLLLSLADVDVQELLVPTDGTAVVRVELEGLPFTLDLAPYSPRTLGYQVFEDRGGDDLLLHAPGPVRTVRGEVREDPGSIVAGSLLDDGLYAKVVLSSGDLYWIEPLVGKTDLASFGDHAVYHQDDVLALPGLCGTDRLAPVQPPPGFQRGDGAGTAGTTAVKVAELGIDADFEYYQDYGNSVTNVENRINLVINTMNVQYETEVQIRHDISVLIVRTAAGGGGYTSNDPNTLLNQFVQEWTTNQAGQPRDVAQLFTGKNLNGGVIGIAFVGVVCNFSFHYGLVESDCCGSLSCSTDLSAHELGHNWSADHCDCPGFTMNAGLTCANTFHDTLTEPEIIAHRDSVGCLDDDVSGGTVILLDDFESGDFTAGGWTISDSGRCVVKKKASFTGTWGARLKKGGQGTGACLVGTDETWIHTPSFSTAGFTSADLLMHSHFRKQEIGCEFMDVQYSVSGGAWVSFAQIDKHAWDEYTIALPAATIGQADVRIRFITNAKGQAERAEIDNFCVLGN